MAWRGISRDWRDLNQFSINRVLLGFGLANATAWLFWLGGLSPVHADSKSITISSAKQDYALNDGESHFEGNVQVAMDGTQVSGSQADFKMDKDGKADTAVFKSRSTMVRTQGGSKQTIQADTMNMGLKNGNVQAQGGVVTQMSSGGASTPTPPDKSSKPGAAAPASGNGQMAIQSSTQEFDQDHHTMTAKGNVVVKKDDLTVTSPQALVFMNAAGGADKAVFTQGAHLLQGTQQLTAETITVKIDSGNVYAEKNTHSEIASTDSTGKTTQCKVKAYLMEMDKNSGLMLANGNTVVDFDGYIAKGPKAVFYRVNNNLDHIVMTGRARIEDADRIVTGDTVTITVNPRQFNAQGHVSTFIKAKDNKNSTPSTASTSATPVKPAPAAKGKGKLKSGIKSIIKGKAAPSAATSTEPTEMDQELLIEKTVKSDQSAKPSSLSSP